MIERRMLPWLIALGAFVAGAIGLGLACLWWSTDLTMQSYDFWNSDAVNGPVDDEVYRFWDRIQTNAFTLQQLAGPLFSAALAGVFGILAVLARAWDRVGPRQPAADEAVAPLSA